MLEGAVKESRASGGPGCDPSVCPLAAQEPQADSGSLDLGLSSCKMKVS